MRAAVECRFEGRTVTVEEALNIRDSAARSKRKALEFLCIECGEALRPHRTGENSAAHFEHLRRNNSCSFSASPNPANTGTQMATFDINDKKAIEGYELDRFLTSHGRNAGLVKSCKDRDKYTCQACNFHLKVHGKYVIECHHTKPVASSGEREVLLDELICLCPTCHRIAHTRQEPLSLAEIKQARGDI
jgi:predicted HNH restriction endonuclease